MGVQMKNANTRIQNDWVVMLKKEKKVMASTTKFVTESVFLMEMPFLCWESGKTKELSRILQAKNTKYLSAAILKLALLAIDLDKPLFCKQHCESFWGCV